MGGMVNDPYELLGVSRNADPAEIKKAFRRLAKKYHPDIIGGTGEKFKRLILAYEQLSGFYERPAAEAQQYDWVVKVNIDRQNNAVQDLFDDLRDGVLTFFDLDPPEYLDLFLELTPEEAGRGGRLKLDLPLMRKCRRCFGFGEIAFIRCHNCGGTGEETYNRAAYLDIPAGIRHGAQTRLRIDNLFLTVIFRVAGKGSDI